MRPVLGELGGIPAAVAAAGAAGVSPGAAPSREVTEMRARLYLNLGLVYDSLKEPAKREHYIKKSVFLAE